MADTNSKTVYIGGEGNTSTETNYKKKEDYILYEQHKNNNKHDETDETDEETDEETEEKEENEEKEEKEEKADETINDDKKEETKINDDDESSDSSSNDETDDDESNSDDTESSINTEELLNIDPLYYRLSRFLQTNVEGENEVKNVAELLVDINNSLISLNKTMKGMIKKKDK